MSLLRICATPGCETRTLGEFCAAHETLPLRRQLGPQQLTRPHRLGSGPQRTPVKRAESTPAGAPQA